MPKDGTATRARILDAAEQLVIENGYAATSVDQVLQAATTSKGAFFHHFDSKLALAQALVDRYADADVVHLETALAKTASVTDPVERVIAFLRYFEDEADEIMSAQSSCLYVAVLTERQLAVSGTNARIVAAIDAWRIAIADLLRAAVAERPSARGRRRGRVGEPRLRDLRGRLPAVPVDGGRRPHARPAQGPPPVGRGPAGPMTVRQ